MELLHPACADAAHPCFTDKMRLWRGRGPDVSIPEGWKGPSVRLRANEAVAHAVAQGNDPVYMGKRWV